MVVKITAEIGGTWQKGGRRSWFWTIGEMPHFGKKARTGMSGGQKIKVRLSYWPIESGGRELLKKGLQVPQKALKGESGDTGQEYSLRAQEKLEPGPGPALHHFMRGSSQAPRQDGVGWEGRSVSMIHEALLATEERDGAAKGTEGLRPESHQ